MLSAPLRTRGTFERTAQPGSLRVPETLSDALMERLDRVAPSRRVAQIAAVIGREFPYDLLSAASQIDEDDMQSALSLLEQADIIYRVFVSPSNMCCCVMQSTTLCLGVRGSRSMRTSRRS